MVLFLPSFSRLFDVKVRRWANQYYYMAKIGEGLTAVLFLQYTNYMQFPLKELNKIVGVSA